MFVCVCPRMLGRCNDASFHRCIRRFTDSNDASIHSSIHQCIKCVRCGSFAIPFQYFSICCAVVVLISGLFWYHFVSLGVHFNVILMAVWVFWRPCALQGSPERGRVENVSKKVVRGSTPGPPRAPKIYQNQ